METQTGYQVNKKENFYFVIKLVVSVIFYGILLKYIISGFFDFNPANIVLYGIMGYVALILLLLFFRLGVILGYIRGNAVKVSSKQFPDIYQTVEKQSAMLELKNIPTVYILQSGGLLNAYAMRFAGNNYIVLYSEIVESAYEQDKSILDFIIGHELGHIKRKHMLKNLLLFPGNIIPFLGLAYSRACEYTCDAIGHCVAPSGLQGGLLILASGRSIYKRVNVSEYLLQAQSGGGFWKWFAEKASTHPNLSKRLAVYESELILNQTVRKPIVNQHETMQPTSVADDLKAEEKVDDHLKYMPK